MVKTLLIGGMLLAVIGGALYIPKIIHLRDEVSVVSHYDCTERDSLCSGMIENFGEVSLLIEPASLPVMEPLKLVVNVPVKEVTSVTLQFVGLKMEMGLQPVVLVQDPLAPQSWRGEGMVSLCTVDADMEWLARLTAVTSNKTYVSEFLVGSAKHK